MSEFSQTRSFNLGVAQDTNVLAALIYDDLAYAQQMVGRGKWFFRSYEQLMRRLPYSEKTLRKSVKLLEEKGWVISQVKKLNGAPICHYQISRFLTGEMTETMETGEMTETIYNSNSITTQGTLVSDLAVEPKRDSSGVVKMPTTELLQRLIEIVNPREKPTQERIRMLNARCKDYTDDEIVSATRAFSQSVWHRENKQMSIDNLLAPSKFGRWYTKGTELMPQGEMVRDEVIAKGSDFPAEWPKNTPEFTYDENEKVYFRGVKVTASNQSELVRIQGERTSGTN